MAEGHVDVVRAREGGLMGGMFAIFTPDPRGRAAMGAGATGPRDVPPNGPVDTGHALAFTLRLFARLRRLADAGHLRITHDVDAIRAAMDEGVLAAVPHLEGAEAIPPDLEALDAFHELGLRSLGLTWSRPNAFATGVPFAFPGGPDAGPGLTADGRELVHACDRLRIVLDVSHLNERGFWDVLRRAERPVVASHSNAHALCPSPRNLTDAQLDALAERNGLVGINFACAFLREDGRDDPETGLEVVVRQLEYVLARVGEDGVALGSDFDGTTVPAALGDASGLPALWDALRAHGWNEALSRKVGFENWLSLLRRVQEG